MEGRRIKKSVIYTMYFIAFALILTSIYLMEMSSKRSFESEEIPNTYVSRSIFDHTISVISPNVVTENKVLKPYVDEKVEIKKNFYDASADEATQKNSIIYYENTYMQSSGIAYASSEAFNVVAVMKGTVTAVTQDDLLGNIIQITHENGLVSIYEGVSEVTVKVNDTVEAGTVIAKSGTSNLLKDLENQLYFEMILEGKNVNPLLCFDRTLSEIKG